MMRKILTLFSLFIFVHLTYAQDNLLTNGNFETGKADGWKDVKHLTVQSDVVNGGSYAAQLNKKKAGLLQTIALEAGKTYRLSCTAKGENAENSLMFSAQYKNEKNKYAYSRYLILRPSDWQEFSFTFTPNENEASSFRYSFYKVSNNKHWIDDATLVEVKNPETLSDAKEILSTSIGLLNAETKIISQIPLGKIKVSALIEALTVSDKASIVIFPESHKYAYGSNTVTGKYTIRIFAENGTYSDYGIKTTNHTIKSVNNGAKLDAENFIISNITPVLKVSEFKTNIELYEGGELDVLDKATMTPITDQDNTIITENMVVRVSGSGLQQDYTLQLRTIGTENSILTSKIGYINETSTALEELPVGITALLLKNAITVSDYASFKITDQTGKELQDETVLDPNSQIRVAAENSELKIYSITYGAQEITEETISVNTTLEQLSFKKLTLAEEAELHIEHATEPLHASTVNITSHDAWLFFKKVKPKTVAENYLTYIKAFGEPAILDQNVRVVQYAHGTVVIAQPDDFDAVEVFADESFGGKSKKLQPYVYYKVDELGDLNDAISSVKIKRGYYVTLAQNEDGTGYSRVFIADSEDKALEKLPFGLNNSASFVRVIPWRWPHKKGYPHGHEEKLNSAWKYNWSAGKSSTLNVEYVPIKQKLHWPSNSAFDRKGVTHLLGMNEPDRPDQANCSVEAALKIWPSLMATGLRIGSPAPSDGGLGWLFKFIDECDKRNYRVDFVAMHYYRGCKSAQQMINDIKYVHQRTKRPIWITEWNNGADWTKGCKPSSQESNAKTIQAWLNKMDQSGFVERYCIFDWLSGGKTTNWSLWYKRYSDDFTPTGIVYRDHESPLAFDPKKTFGATYHLPAPSELTAALNEETGNVELNWTDGSDVENGVKVERSLNGGEFEEIARIEGADILSYTDETVAFGYYRYRVRQMIANEMNSAASNTVEVSIMHKGVENLARDKSTVTNSATEGYEGSKAVDGELNDNASRWLTEKDAQAPFWLEIDLAEEYVVSAVQFYNGWDGHNRAVKDFKFQYWDGTDWQDLLDIKNNTRAAYKSGFEPTKTSKVRLYVTKTTENRMKLYEIEVFGKKESGTLGTPGTKILQEAVSIFPNPTTEVLMFKGLKTPRQVQILNITGKIIKTAQVLSQLNVSDLETGMYTLRLQGGDSFLFVKK